MSKLQSPPPDIFRQEALDHYLSRREQPGQPLRISPAWVWPMYLVMVFLALAGFAYTLIGRIHEYAEGPAIIRCLGREDLTATLGGTIQSIDVVPGQEVRAGQTLVRYYDALESAELQRINREWKSQLINYLRNPADETARRAISQLRAQREEAQTRLDERRLVAPRDGIIDDIRIRTGQGIGAGQTVCTLLGNDQKPTLIALLPGHYRPQIKTGMPIRVELTGYRYAYQSATIQQVGGELLGPAEVARYLGPDVADSFPLSGAVVVVHADLPSRMFRADDRAYPYYDGMLAQAAVKVRSESILLSFVPGLKRIFGNSNE